MQYRYTVRGGYDRLIKKKVEKGTLFAVPIAMLAIVGLAALTSNTTTGPGIGSGSKGTSGQATVTKTFQTTANNEPAPSGTTPGGDSSAATSATGATTQGSSTGSLGTAGSTVNSIQPSSIGSSTGSTGGTTGSGGGTTGGGTTIIPPDPIPTPPVTLCVKQLDPLTGQEICIN